MNELSYNELKDLSRKEFDAPFPWESHFTSLPHRKEVILKLDLWRSFANESGYTPEIPQNLIDAANGDAPLSSVVVDDVDQNLEGMRSDFEDLINFYNEDHDADKFNEQLDNLALEVKNQYEDTLPNGDLALIGKGAKKLYDEINAAKI